MMNRHPLLATTIMTPAERAVGRFLRAPDHPGLGDEGSDAGEDSTQTDDNKSGNESAEDNESGTKDNRGQETSLDKFWEGKPEDESASDDSEEAGKKVGQELAGIIQGTQFNPLFSKEIAEQIADGDFDGANKAFADAQRHAMAQNTAVFAKLLEEFGGRLMSKVQREITTHIGKTQAVETLESSFPAAKDPAARPIIEGVFNQALVNNKGDRAKAVAETNRVLKAFGKSTGLTTPPPDSGAPVSSGAQSLVDSLLGRDEG